MTQSDCQVKILSKIIMAINAKENTPWYDWIYAQVNPVQNLHNLKFELFYKPFGRSDEKIIGNKDGDIALDFEGKTVYFKKVNKQRVDGGVWEIFIKQEYQKLDVKGKQVIDIGGNVGDTAIYFARRGAKQVLSYEILPELHKSAVYHIKLNHLGKIVKPHLKKVTTLDGIDIEKGAILKMDVEGAEYEIIFKTKKEVLQMFSEIMMEYHYGYKNIMDYLKELGFDVWVSRAHTANINGTRCIVGLLYAAKAK